MVENEIAAPKVDSRQLWKLSVDDFNEWRRTHDFPRIIAALKNELTAFEEWMSDQKVSESLMLEFGIVDFLRPNERIFVYDFEKENGEIEREIRTEEYALNGIIFHKKIVAAKKQVIPFFKWVERNSSK